MVLENADPIQLFAMQRVSKTFQAVIVESKRIRRHMHLEATNVPDYDQTVQLLARNEIHRAVLPFVIDVPEKDEFGIWHILSLPCESIERYRTVPPEQIMATRSQEASWRQVQVGTVDAVYINCFRCCTVAEKDDFAKTAITLGQLVDFAGVAALKQMARGSHRLCVRKNGYRYREALSNPRELQA